MYISCIHVSSIRLQYICIYYLIKGYQAIAYHMSNSSTYTHIIYVLCYMMIIIVRFEVSVHIHYIHYIHTFREVDCLCLPNLFTHSF